MMLYFTLNYREFGVQSHLTEQHHPDRLATLDPTDTSRNLYN